MVGINSAYYLLRYDLTMKRPPTTAKLLLTHTSYTQILTFCYKNYLQYFSKVQTEAGFLLVASNKIVAVVLLDIMTLRKIKYIIIKINGAS